MKDSEIPVIKPLKSMPSKAASPIRHYEKPEEVVTDDSLNKGQKAKVLETWQNDAEALQRAEDEGMSGGESSKLIDVMKAKLKLDNSSE